MSDQQPPAASDTSRHDSPLPDESRSVQDSIVAARLRLERALAAAGRRPDDARLLAVGKKKPARALEQAFEAGQRHFGENYLQEALDKQAALAHLPALCWHYIGAIQSNKTRDIAEHFDWVHTVDRLKVARRLSDTRPAGLAPLNICLQVNISREPAKAGVAPEALEALAGEVLTLPGLRLRGLMALPAPSDDRAAQRRPFAAMRALLATLAERHPEAALDTLSMGMSGDLEAAVAEGATIVRLGTALFGPRDRSGAATFDR